MTGWIYAPVLCNVTIMYATSSTNESSVLSDVYFVASFQKFVSGSDFSLNINSFNN